MSGEQVAAATTISFGFYNINLSDFGSYDPEILKLSEVGDVMERASSGGCFAIDNNSDSGITDYLTFDPNNYTASDGTTKFYTSAELKSVLPVEYKAIQIASASLLTNSEGTILSTFDQWPLYSIKLQWVPAQTYTLNYDLNGGTGTAIASRKQQLEKAYSLENPSDWTKKGYEFNGWSFSSDRSGSHTACG